MSDLKAERFSGCLMSCGINLHFTIPLTEENLLSYSSKICRILLPKLHRNDFESENITFAEKQPLRPQVTIMG